MTQAGKLRHRAELQSKVEVSDGAGGVAVSWLTERKFWCNRRPLSTEQRLENQRRKSTTDHEIDARYAEDVDATKRLVIEGEVFNIDGQPLKKDGRTADMTIPATRGVAT